MSLFLEPTPVIADVDEKFSCKNVTKFFLSTSNSTSNDSTSQPDGGISSVLVVNGALAIGLFLVFCFLRVFMKEYYCPRYFWRHLFEPKSTSPSSTEVNSSVERDEHLVYSEITSTLHKFARSGFFGWVLLLIKLEDEKLISLCGLDAFLYMRFMKQLIKLFVMLTLFSLLVVMPVNIFAGDDGTINRTTMSNIKQNSDLLWVHTIASILYSVLVVHTVFKLYKEFVERREEYKKHKEMVSNHSILIQEVPKHLRTNSQLLEKVQSLYNGSTIIEARRALYSSELSQCLQRKEQILVKIDRAEHELHTTGVRPTHRILTPTDPAKQVDSLAHYREKIEELEHQIANHIQQLNELADGAPQVARESVSNQNNSEIEEHTTSNGGFRKTLKLGANEVVSTVADQVQKVRQGVSAINPFTSDPRSEVAFVTFSTIKEANIAAQLLVSRRTNKWLVTPAPEPAAVNWEYLKFGAEQQFVRWWLMFGAAAFLTLFAVIPTTLLSSLFSFHTLCSIAPSFVEAIQNNLPAPIRAFITSFVPTLGTLIFMLLLIPVLTLLAKQEAHYDKSITDRSLMVKYFTFLVVNLIIASALPQLLKLLRLEVQTPCDIFGSPSNNFLLCVLFAIAQTLGEAMPPSAFLLVNYTLHAFLTGGGLGLLRLGAVILPYIQTKSTKTVSERDAVLKGSLAPFPYSISYALHLSIVTITLTYSVMVPIASLVGLFYLVFWFLIDKYNILCIHTHPYERAGILASSAVTVLFASVLIFQFTMAGLFVVKLKPAPTVIMLCLVVATIICFWAMKKYFRNLGKFLPLEALDPRVCEQANPELLASFRKAYIQPELRHKYEEAKLNVIEKPVTNISDD